MAGSRVQLSSVQRALMCAVMTALVALVAVAAGPVSAAMAEPPPITIVSPAEGGSILDPTPWFSGTTNGTLNSVTLHIYSGPSAAGTLVREEITTLGPAAGEWSLTPTPLLGEGTYTALATQPYELETSTSGPVTFTVDAAPVITSNPGDQTVLAGEPATFTASSSGTPTPGVQWQVSTDGGSTWVPDTTDAVSATDTLTIANTTTVESGQENREYQAVFTNGVGSPATSTTATLIVNAAPVVITNPASRGIKVGGSAMFTASASGAPTPTVQWQESTDLGATWVNDTTDAGNTTGTLTVLGTTVAENGDEFRAVFTNAIGPPVPSAAATLTVSEKEVAPVITSDPVDQTVLANEGAAFMAAASGVPTPAVKWQISTDGGATWANDKTDSGSTTETLTVLSPTLAESGREFRAVFTNMAGTVTSAPATLTVAKRAVAPVVTTNPSSKSVVLGETTAFVAAASGVPTPEVQWQLSTDNGATWANDITDAGNSTGTLTVIGTTVAESGYEYRAVFANQAGTVTSSAVTFSVTSPPSLAPPAPPTTPTPTPTPAPTPPAAAFTWLPAKPTTGESVVLASSSTDADSPLTAYAWDATGSGTFTAGGPAITTSFVTPGNHTVRLRVADGNGLTRVATETIPVSAAPLVLMQPFPVVRIAGSESSSGVKLSLLTVQAPVGTRVSLTCGGSHCPRRSESRVVVASSKNSKAGSVLLTFSKFERSLHAGVMLEIRVSKPGEIGKYTSFRIRPNKAPARVDACVGPSTPKPIPCPSS
jgi:hypothetical protein